MAIAAFAALAVTVAGWTQADTAPLPQPGRTVEARMKLPAKYKAQPTRMVADLPGFESVVGSERSPFGGDMKMPRSKATGFFRTEKIGDRWWLIDPQGYRTINTAVVSTHVKQMSPRTQQAFDKLFGNKERWAEQTRKMLREAGFDGTGNWSDDRALAAGTTSSGADRPIVRTAECSFMGAYAKERGGTHAEPGHLGYPGKCIFVFDPEFAAAVDSLASNIAASKDDPYLLGWFTDNELPFPLDALDLYLKLPAGDPGRIAADAFIAGRNLKPNALTDEDRQAWIAVMADKYFKTVHDAIRRVDPNHLILGPRFHATDHRNPALLAAAGKYVDVIGYNMYGVWSPSEITKRISNSSGRPVLITEFYAKADDSGLTNKDGAGWNVHTQADRAAFFENFTLDLIQSRACVGWQWFKYNDNDPTFANGTTPSDSNKGVVTNLFEPYGTLLNSMKLVNVNRYALAEYFDRQK